MNQDQAFKITPAQYSDIEQMIAICEQNLVENNRDKFAAEDFSKKGFLISRLTLDDAKKMIDDQNNSFACVIKNGAEVLGYLTGCDLEKYGTKFFENVPSLEKIKNEKIFYHKQIVKKPDAKNIGKKLLFAMFDEAKNRGYSHVICRIVHAPFCNETSISFHEKFGFQKIGSTEENGVTLGIYLKNL
jgi:GNAT superfamily N-acetyltransferase